MLRAASAEVRGRPAPGAPQDSGSGESTSPVAEKRPGPTKGTSWKEVQHVRGSLTSSTSGRSSGDPDAAEEAEVKQVRIKDLDSGREYKIPQKYTIRDLNTGQLFALCKDTSDSSSTEVAQDRVTDFASGKQLSLEEFDVALGLKRRDNSATDGHNHKRDSDRANLVGVGSSSQSAGLKTKSWLKRIQLGKKKSAPESDGSGSESTTSTPGVAAPHSSLARNSGTASVSGRTPVRVQVHRKLYKELAGLAMVQSLQAHNGVVWAMQFSHNGKFLATAGQDATVHVWEVASHRGSKAAESKSNGQLGAQQQGNGLQTAPQPESENMVFSPTPHRTYQGHKQDVLDLSWSKSLFLLTASMDKSVRLWHVSMDECLRVFRHTDFVTALDFHPVDDKHFVSGSIDGKVRLWNIPEQNGRVVDYADVHEMVTATTFSADGTRAIVGTMKGKCKFYQCSPEFKLEYQAQIDVKNRRGKTSRGRKITGLQFLPDDPTKLLITSNDSRLRLYDGFTLRCKYKGLHNTNTQIRASFSQNGDFIICGSDDGSVYFWTTAAGSKAASLPALTDDKLKQEKTGAFESFNAFEDIATVAIFAPEATKRQLTRKPVALPDKVASASESISRLGLKSKFSKEEVAEAAEAGEAAIASARAHGQVVLAAGYSGEIKIYENLAVPHWL